MLSGLPSAGTWTLTRTPGSVTSTGTGTSTAITGLSEGIYTYTVTNSSGCISGVTSDIVINTPPPVPSTPIAGVVAQPDCVTPTGSIVLNGLPDTGNWTLIRIPGGPAYTGAGTSYTISGLISGSYSYSVTNSFGCTSALSGRVLIGSAPPSPAAPVAGTIIQPGCTLSTGSVTLIGLPVTGTWTLTTLSTGSSFTGTGGSTTISGLATGSYTYSVTNSDGCTSPPSAAVVINPQPSIPSAPTIVSVTQPTCSMVTGSLALGGLPSSGSWTLTRFQDGTTTTGIGTANTLSGLPTGNYAYSVTDANGCTSPVSENTFFSSAEGPLAVTRTITNPVCGAPNGVITLGSVIGGTPPYSYSVDGSAFTGTTIFANLPEGVHTIVVKDNKDCNVTSAVTLTNTPGPSSMVFQATDVLCGLPNGTITLGLVTGGTPPYSYSVDGSAFAPATRYTGLTSGSHTLSVKDNNGCNFSTTATLLNIGGPTAIATLVTDEICGAGNGALSLGAVTGGTPPYSYSVDGSDFAQTKTYSNLSAGTHTITVKDSNGCDFSTTANITNMSGPTALATQVTDATCGAANGVLTLGAVSGGTSPYSYSVDGSAFTPATSYSNLAAGSHTIGVKDGNGCSYSTPAIVQDIKGPTVIAISITDETCGAGNGVLSLGTVTGGTSPYSYSVDGSAFTQATTYSHLSAGSHTVTVKDTNGCSITTPAVLVNRSGPTAIASQVTDAACGVPNGIIALGSVTGGTSPYTYSLDGGAFTGTTSYSGLSAGLHTIAVRDKNGCTYSTPLTIVQLPATTATLQGDTAVCTGSVVPLTVKLTGTAPWSIIYTDGETTVPVTNIVSSPFRIKVSPQKTTTYALTSVSDANCSGKIGGSAVITVAQRVLPTFTPLGPLLVNAVAPALPGLSLNGISGRWSPASISTAGSGTTIYTFTPDAAECAVSTTMSVTIDIQAVIAQTDSLPVTSVIQAGACQGINLNGLKSIGNIVAYQWSSLDTGGSLTPPTGATTTFTLSGDYTGTLPADFRIKLKVTDINGYTDSDTVTISMNPLPVARVTSSGTLQKDGSMIVDGSGSNGTAITYKWSTNQGRVVGADNQPTVKLFGTGIYLLKISDSYGCTDSKSFQYPLAFHSITANPDYARITWDQDTTINVLANDNSTVYLRPGTVTVTQPATRGGTKVNPDGTITYAPQGTTVGSDTFIYQVCDTLDFCASAKVTIDIYESVLKIPEGFSPNGDGENDLLVFPDLPQNHPNSQLYVYTRSGQLVYQSLNYLNNWDGRMSNHQLVPTGTYYYVLKLTVPYERIIKSFIYIGY